MDNVLHYLAGKVWLAVLLFVVPAFGSTNNLVKNPSFEVGTTSWTLFAQGLGVGYMLTNDAAEGATAILATNRSSLTHHVSQDILTNLLAEGPGPFGVEFSIKLPSPGNARAVLQMTDSAGSRTPILAEKLIDADTGTWVRVRGLPSLSWQGALTQASLRFEFGLFAEGVYPPALLDHIRIVRDTDRDGIADDLDPQPGLADANTNQIPDGWESDFALPSLAGTADTDGDGFSNVQEFWAATNPTNAWSKPGQPVNTQATPEARAVLQYLALLPSLPTQRVVVGQVVTDTLPDFSNQVAALAAETGRWPAMLGVVYDMINGPINHAVITPVATNYWNDGGLVHVQWNPDNPWNGGFSGNTNNIDFPSLFTPGSPSHSNYLAILDEVAAGLQALGDAGLTVLFRPLCECNSTQNWYQRRARNEYIPLFRWTFDYLAKSQGLNHVLWVYDALNGPHQQVPVNYYYPGDDVVDVFGVNLYDDDWVPAFDLDRVSRYYPKPLAIPEGGSSTIFDGTFSNMTYITAISNSYPRLSYFAIYNSFISTTQKLYGLVDNIGSSNLFAHPWIVTRESLAWRRYLGPFGSWQLDAFSTNANRRWMAGVDADPDADLAPNLLEYATGTDPLQPSPPSLLPHPVGLTFLVNTAATDLAFTVESSSNLQSQAWTSIASNQGYAAWQTATNVTVVNSGNGSATLQFDASQPASFYRLHIVKP